MNMIEKVARAICEAGGQDPDHLEPGDAHGIDAHLENGDPAFLWWKEFIPQARAAIEAMREPTEAVLSMIAYGAIGPGMEATGASREVALSNWQAGVDGALIEGPTS